MAKTSPNGRRNLGGKLAFRISPETKVVLQQIAAERFLEVSDIGREAIRYYLANRTEGKSK